ncbi:tail fiber adhesin [Serratia phage X20]|uniref:Tail fiber adhesin n=3 Tax=Winklervirus TaxID=2560256 RepID=A0A1Z1LZH6_9CAUD|nr:tail fiber adhesin [Serratia phage CHI14]YP_010092407.1 tail fiber adhesin [Serratia phage X20]ARW57677.1 distal long tail fiber assembly catalyst [Serratia phage CHI14]ARW57952.1 distal long tail fiber assembly catalyst [Serratia phage CBH8]ARW58229.1 tail fiber adhesin [Serratia phage X20]
MAIVGVPGWIGESAAVETGQRWMASAGSVLGIGTPFWMSSLAGKSRSFFLTVGRNVWTTPLAGDATDVGHGLSNYGSVTIGKLENADGIWGGITYLLASRSRVSTSASITGKNLPKRNLILKIGGTNFQFNYLKQTISGTVWETWGAADVNGLFNFLNARVNQRLECIPQN